MRYLVNFVRNFNDIEDELDITEVFSKIKDGEFEDEILRYRYALSQNDSKAPTYKNKLLGFTPAGLFNESRKTEALKIYSGILHVDLDKITNEELFKLTIELKKDNTVFAFFISPSGNGLKVFYKTNDNAEKHSKNSSLLNILFETKYGIKPDSQIKDIPRLCYVSSDPNLYLNENSQSVDFSFHTVFNKIEILKSQLEKSFKIKFEKGQRNSFLLKLASQCRNNQVVKELLIDYCVRFLLTEDFEIEEIKNTINSAYANNYYESKILQHRKLSKHELLEELLNEMNYKFRFNLIKKQIEVCNNNNQWIEVDDRLENDIIRQIESSGVSIRLGSLKTSLNSSFSYDYNPFVEYLYNLPQWDGRDHILELFNTLNTSEDILMYLKKWLVCLVASILDSNIQNQTVLLLVGNQGVGKSRWLNKLIPLSLKQYSVQGIFDPRDKDTKILMSENLIGNLDELDSIEKRDVPKFKEFITSPGTKLRASYARNATHFPRRISFCGSVNSLDFLQDQTGSRRFLCIETENLIDHTHTIDMDLVYSQALALFESGYIPYFNADEINQIQERNTKFQVYSIEEDIIHKYFEENIDAKPNERMSILEIYQAINNVLGDGIKINISTQKLGKILSRLGYKKVKSGGYFAYCIKLKERESR
jgi:predicted P-loop ATPase